MSLLLVLFSALIISALILLVFAHYYGGFTNMRRYAPQQLTGLSVAVFGFGILAAIAIHGVWMLNWSRNTAGDFLGGGMVFIVIGAVIFLNASMKKD